MSAPRANPFEVIPLTAFGLLCIATLTRFDVLATGTLRAFPVLWAKIFLVLFGLACVFAVFGALRNTTTGVLLEQVGLYAMTGITWAYAFWSFGVLGARANAFAISMLAFGIASFWRAIQIRSALRIARSEGGT